jgi:hypothetical protein
MFVITFGWVQQQTHWVQQQTHPKVMTNMLKKVFNWSEVHLSEVTSYKIHTLGVSLRVLYCVVDTDYGLGRYLGDCRPALPEG